MKLGLYTECFGNRSFEEMLSLSQSMGIKYLRSEPETGLNQLIWI